MLYGGGENKFTGTLGQQDVDISFPLLKSYFQMSRMHTLWEQILRRQTSLIYFWTENIYNCLKSLLITEIVSVFLKERNKQKLNGGTS